MKTRFYLECREENERQKKDFGEQNHSYHEWFAILGEEVGEVAKLLNDIPGNGTDYFELKNELVQVGAVCRLFYDSVEKDDIIMMQEAYGLLIPEDGEEIENA